MLPLLRAEGPYVVCHIHRIDGYVKLPPPLHGGIVYCCYRSQKGKVNLFFVLCKEREGIRVDILPFDLSGLVLK